MFGTISIKNYLLIAVAVGLAFGIINALAAAPLSGFISELRAMAVAGGLPVALADIVAEPLLLLINGGVVGAVVAGAFWPLVLLWLFLLLVLMVLAFLLPGARQAGEGIRLN